MQIVFSNSQTIDLCLNRTPVALTYQKMYKHLQHVDIPFQDWDNPFYFFNHSLAQMVDKLIIYAGKVGVPIDKQRCLSQDQDYFNALHAVYENNWNNGQEWSDFHRHLHMCEKNHLDETLMQKTLKIDYNQKSGLLEKQFSKEWLVDATSEINAGDVFVCWQELGKTPYTYWIDKEPNNIDRMQQVIKPWTKLKPNIFIALVDISFKKDPKELEEFRSWWNQYSHELCQYWNITSWNLDDMFKFIKLGKVSCVDTIIKLLKNNVKPTRVIL